MWPRFVIKNNKTNRFIGFDKNDNPIECGLYKACFLVATEIFKLLEKLEIENKDADYEVREVHISTRKI